MKKAAKTKDVLKVDDRVRVVKGPFETSKGVVKNGCIGRVISRYDDKQDFIRVEIYGPFVTLVKPSDNFEKQT